MIDGGCESEFRIGNAEFGNEKNQNNPHFNAPEDSFFNETTKPRNPEPRTSEPNVTKKLTLSSILFYNVDNSENYIPCAADFYHKISSIL